MTNVTEHPAVPGDLERAMAPTPGSGPDHRSPWALAIIAVAQLMIVLDATVVTIALPSAQKALHISVANRQWVMTAYTLAFGGLLLLGGRLADYLGRRRMFVVSLLGFAAASALGGLAQNAAMLFGARALQGAFAAIMAPAALSLLTVTFTEPRERARAFGVYGALSGGGAAIGLIMGGLLTQYVSWRWTLLINAPIAVITAALASGALRESRAEGTTRYDIPGAIAVTGGLLSLVYAFTKAASDGWGSTPTVALLAIAALALTVFVMVERRASHPLLPLRVLLERSRGGALAAALLVGTALFGMFLFLTYYLQLTLHYSALRTGFAFLPFSAGIVVGAGLSSRLLTRTGPRGLISGGIALAAVGLVWFMGIGVHTAYAVHVLPAELVVSFGMGLCFVPLNSTALTGVDGSDAGVASGLINATQQIGGSMGTALLNTIAATATSSYVLAHGRGSVAAAAGLVHGYTTAFAVGAGLLAAAAVLSFALVRGSGTSGVAPDRAIGLSDEMAIGLADEMVTS
jgi:EmrB/QacA subfamily drug resistance transporter